MAQQTMYDGAVNSPITTITNNISSTDTIIYVLDDTKIPDAPNLLVIGGNLQGAETVLMTSKNGSEITVQRGFQGTAVAWNSGATIARNFTEYDYRMLKENVEDLSTGKVDKITGKQLSTEDYSTAEKTKLSGIETGATADQAADEVPFDNTASGLTAGHVQGAIDELRNKFFDIQNNAGFHNSIFRGKYLGSSVTAAQYAEIAAGTFKDLYIGDYWTIGGINYRIAAFNYYRNTGDTLVPGNHITLVPDTQLYIHVMNDTNITTGGYIGSKMYISGLDAAKTTINAAFPGHVVTIRRYLSNATTDGVASAGSWYDSDVELMNEVMVYGSRVNIGTLRGLYDIGTEKSQLPLFALNPQSINTRQSYWLRDVYSSTFFALVSSNGDALSFNASYSSGVRPAFSIS